MVCQPESIVVIGGGLAGLAAGTRILDGGFEGDLHLLERSPSLGGRTGSLEYGDRILDLGQHMHVSGFDYYQKFLERIGLKDRFWTQSRLDVEFRDGDGRTGRVKSSRFPPPFHLASAFVDFPFISLKDKLSLAGPLLPALLFDYRENSKSISFGDWLRNRGASEASINKLWNHIIVPTLNSGVDEVSVEMGMMILKRVLLDKQGGRLGRLHDPMVSIGEEAAGFIKENGGRVSTSSPVGEIILKEKGKHLVQLRDGRTVETEIVISAVPGHRLETMLSDSALDRFEHPFWRLEWNSIINVHLMFAESVMEEKFFGYLEGTAGWVFNVEHEGERSGRHICLTISDPGELEELDPDDLVEKVKRELTSPLPDIKRTKMEDSIAIYQPRATFKVTPASNSLRPPQNPAQERFFLAGDWTDTGWPSTMESAVRSGYYAADAVLDNLES